MWNTQWRHAVSSSHHLIAERFRRGSTLPNLLRCLDLQKRHQRNCTLPFVDLRARLRIGAAHTRPPGAPVTDLAHCLLVQWAIQVFRSHWSVGHGSIFGSKNNICIFYAKIHRRSRPAKSNCDRMRMRSIGACHSRLLPRIYITIATARPRACIDV